MDASVPWQKAFEHTWRVLTSLKRDETRRDEAASSAREVWHAGFFRGGRRGRGGRVTVEAFFPPRACRQAGAVCLPLADCFMCFEVSATRVTVSGWGTQDVLCHQKKKAGGRCYNPHAFFFFFFKSFLFCYGVQTLNSHSLHSLQLALFSMSALTRKEALCEIRIENDLIEQGTDSCF